MSESDLRIADQYLQRIITTTGSEITGLSESLRFDGMLRNSPRRLPGFLDETRRALGLDFLYYLPQARHDSAPATGQSSPPQSTAGP